MWVRRTDTTRSGEQQLTKAMSCRWYLIPGKNINMHPVTSEVSIVNEVWNEITKQRQSNGFLDLSVRGSATT